MERRIVRQYPFYYPRCEPAEFDGKFFSTPDKISLTISLSLVRGSISMPPAARSTDMHTCPVTTGPAPHVGGPILPPCAPSVLIGFLPAARVSDMATCTGPPDIIIVGSGTVQIEYMPAARLGDPTAHGGVIVSGEPTVDIGG
jgi:uncharacterized Zn-binding protein involved in type VI secretion